MLSESFLKCRAWIGMAIAVLSYPFVIFAVVIGFIWKSIYKTRKSIAGEVALITGGANGLGRDIALKLAAKGCHIAVVDINEEAAITTAKLLSDTYSVKAKAFKVNVTQFDEVKALSKNVEEELGPVTILVNNAGIMTFSTFINPPPAEVQNMINTNLTSHIWTVRVFMDKMRELRRGHIVAISSMAGVIPCHRQLEYSATKFGVRGFMAALRTELYSLNCEFIKTTTVFPFFLKTNAKVVDIFEKAGINLYPSITGEEAAKAIVEGIITNEMEVFIPGLMALSYRLLEFLPKDWQMNVINGIVGHERASKLAY